jgi:hypothetical protein
MNEQKFKTAIEQLLINRTKRKGDPSWMKTSIFEFAEAYTAAQVSAKDAEIAELTRKLQIQDTMHQNAESVLTEENKRLREGIAETVKYIKGPHHSNPEPIAIYEILQPLLSPSDVDGETKAAPVVDAPDATHLEAIRMRLKLCLIQNEIRGAVKDSYDVVDLKIKLRRIVKEALNQIEGINDKPFDYSCTIPTGAVVHVADCRKEGVIIHFINPLLAPNGLSTVNVFDNENGKNTLFRISDDAALATLGLLMKKYLDI